MINEFCDFVDNTFSPEATSLSSLVAIGIAEVEKERSSFVMWSPDYLIKGSRYFAGGGRDHLNTSACQV